MFRWHTSFDEVSDLNLWVNSNSDRNLFCSWELGRLWFDFYTPKNHAELRILHIEEDFGSLLWPLCISHGGWDKAFQKTLMPLGTGFFDYGGPICQGDAPQLWNIALEAISSLPGWDYFLARGLFEKYEKCTEESEIAPFISLEGIDDVSFYLQKAKKSLREDVRRQINNCKKNGTLEYFRCTKEEALSLFDVYNQFHISRWGWTLNYSFATKMLDGIPSNVVCFDCLKINGEPAALCLGFQDQYSYGYYKPVVNPKYHKQSPGKILLYYLLDQTIKSGRKKFDLLRGNEVYKFAWTQETRPLYVIEQKNPRFSSQVINFLSGILQSLSHLFKKLHWNVKHRIFKR